MHSFASRLFRTKKRSGFIRPVLALLAIFAFSMCFILSAAEKNFKPNLRLVDNQLSGQVFLEQEKVPVLIFQEEQSLNQTRDRAGQPQLTHSSAPKFCLPFFAQCPSLPGNVPAIGVFSPCAEEALLLPGPDGRIPYSLPPPSEYKA